MANNSFIVEIDTSRGAVAKRASLKPAVIDDILIWVRGYISNESSLLDRLAYPKQAHRCEESKTSWLIAQAYRKWDYGLQEMVSGEYMAVALDIRGRKGIAVNDAFGLRPLFYYERGSLLAISTHPELISSAYNINDLDDSYVSDFLTLNRHYGSRTLFKGCSRLTSGSTIRLGRSIRIVKTYDIRNTKCRKEIDMDVLGEEFRNRLRVEVQRSLSAGLSSDSDRKGTKWVELSGGLDSSSIASTASRLDISDIEAISLTYDRSTTADEKVWMKKVIERTGLLWNTINEDDHLPFAEAPGRWVGYPYDALLSWGVFSRYSKLAERQDVVLSLSGLGGDQVCFGEQPMPLFLADDLQKIRFWSFLRAARAWTDESEEPRSYRHLLWYGAVRPLLNYFRGIRIWEGPPQGKNCSWLSDDFRQNHRLDERRVSASRPMAPRVSQQFFCDHLQVISSSAEHHWNQLLNSFDLRFPLLGRPIVEFMYSISPRQWYEPNTNRVVMREAMKGIIPEKVRQRTDKQGPDQAYFLGLKTNRRIQSILLRRSALAERGYVDAAAWNRVVEGAILGYVPRSSTFFASVALELWLRQHEWSGWSPPTADSILSSLQDVQTQTQKMTRQIDEPIQR